MVKCHERGEGEKERRGALAENQGFLFFLLLPKVLLLPSVTLAKNCEHESRGVRHMVSDAVYGARGRGRAPAWRKL